MKKIIAEEALVAINDLKNKVLAARAERDEARAALKRRCPHFQWNSQTDSCAECGLTREEVRGPLPKEDERVTRLTAERDDGTGEMQSEIDRLRALLREVIAHIEEEVSPDPSYVTLCVRLAAALEGRDG